MSLWAYWRFFTDTSRGYGMFKHHPVLREGLKSNLTERTLIWSMVERLWKWLRKLILSKYLQLWWQQMEKQFVEANCYHFQSNTIFHCEMWFSVESEWRDRLSVPTCWKALEKGQNGTKRGGKVCKLCNILAPSPSSCSVFMLNLTAALRKTPPNDQCFVETMKIRCQLTQFSA